MSNDKTPKFHQNYIKFKLDFSVPKHSPKIVQIYYYPTTKGKRGFVKGRPRKGSGKFLSPGVLFYYRVLLPGRGKRSPIFFTNQFEGKENAEKSTNSFDFLHSSRLSPTLVKSDPLSLRQSGLCLRFRWTGSYLRKI